MEYIKNILIGIDQLTNCVFLGKPDETISARCWRNRNKNIIWKISRKVIDTIFWFDDNHCQESYDSELYRTQISKEYKENNK